MANVVDGGAVIGRFLWLARRLARMDRAEIGHRARQAAGLVLLEARARLPGALPGPADYDPANYNFCRARAPVLPALPWDFAPDAEMRARLLSGDHGALGFPWSWSAAPDAWHVAPDTGRLWPRRSAMRIAYRPGNPIGDIRAAWEPSRLQHLVGLALLARADPDEGVRAAAIQRLGAEFRSWVAANPFLRGIHYVSAMECGLRILSLCHAFDIARPDLADETELWAALVRVVDSHARLIRARLSLHSSAGNHTVAEAAGLLYAGVLFPELPSASEWQRMGLDLLTREAGRQVLPDGGGIEQAFWYHLFVVDLLGLAAALLDGAGEPAPEPLRAACRRGRHFLNAVARGPADLPRIGDADDGWALSPYLRLSWGEKADPGAGGTALFPDAGYSVVHHPDPRCGRILFDHGPLGMGPLYAHGHADALSVTLWDRDEALLIDPGTFGYGCAPEWRRYFRGTAAHNTVTVDGQDQAVQSGAFMWTGAYRAERVADAEWAGGFLVLARHCGYARLGLVHWRAVARVRRLGWVVWDRLEGEGAHRFVLHWHLAGECRQEADGATVTGPGGLWRLAVEGGALALISGETAPPLGWRAPAYGVRVRATMLAATHEGQAPHVFTTAIVQPAVQDAVDGPALSRLVQDVQARCAALVERHRNDPFR